MGGVVARAGNIEVKARAEGGEKSSGLRCKSYVKPAVAKIGNQDPGDVTPQDAVP